MVLEKLEINGFKSFDKKVILDFKHPIVGIVGPNGSGKSNILEAFRFVLGEQSIKNMRGKKGEDLIFNGGNKGARKNLASISITFKNEDNLFDIEYPSITIERKVHRDGTNEYLINGSKNKLKDIIELLSKANITPRGNQIISQGQADWILNANISDRREIIEDGLGLKIFQYRKKDSERKMERTRSQIEQVELLRKEIQPHLKFLKKQAEKIEAYKALTGELSEEYKIYIGNEKSCIEREEKSLKEHMHTLTEEEKTIVYIPENRNVSTEHKDKIKEIEKQIQSVREHKNKILFEIGKLEGAMEIRKQGKHISQEQFDSLRGKIENIVNDSETTEDINILKGLFTKIKQLFIKLTPEELNHEERAKEYENKKEELQNIEIEENKVHTLLKEHQQKNREYEEFLRKEDKKKYEIENKKILIKSQKERLLEKENALKKQIELFNEEIEEGKLLIGDVVDKYLKGESKEIINVEEHKQRRRNIERLKIKIEEIGTTQENSKELMKEYEDIVKRDEELQKEIEDLHQTMDKIVDIIDKLTEEIETKFKSGINEINNHFGLYFKTLFGSGNASIELVKEDKKTKVIYDEHGEEIKIDEETDEREGIEIKVSLPHKRIKTLEALSGGERALISTALIFAISQVTPPPFLILDETDAALDEANSKRYGDIIKQLSSNSQLILITHNRETMSKAEVLYGITMGVNGISKILSVKLAEAISVAK